MTEMTVHYLGGKIEHLTQAIEQAYKDGNTKKAVALEGEFEALMLGADRLLCSHPNLRLDKWLNYARSWGSNQEQKDYYEKNARRIVTIWGPPVDDYSARIWSGLLRDYYLPRWKHYFESKRTGIDFDMPTWERTWVEEKRGLSKVTPYDNVLEACIELINRAQLICLLD